MTTSVNKLGFQVKLDLYSRSKNTEMVSSLNKQYDVNKYNPGNWRLVSF